MIFLHGLNLILAVLAIMVHAFRLNILEFTRHLNMEWSGAQIISRFGGPVGFSLLLFTTKRSVIWSRES